MVTLKSISGVILWWTSFLVSVVDLSSASFGSNFIAYDKLTDGETERLIRYQELTAKETSVRPQGDPNSPSLKLRQVTDGRHFIQLIYGWDGSLKDCEYVKQKAAVKAFLDSFKEAVQHRANVTILTPPKEGGSLPPDTAKWLDYDQLKASCKRNHRMLKKMAKRRSHGPQKKRHRADTFLQRSKRDLMEMLRVPGTKWCGKGTSAEKHNHLGGYGAADKCCRVHDTACPFYVPAFEERYGFFNWRVSTLMHCSCDSRFRACLKMANTGTSNLVGKLFFNVVQTKCFVLKPEKICVKRSWWGKCQKTEFRKQAHMRDNQPY